MSFSQRIRHVSGVRNAARFVLRPVVARRRLPATKFTLRFPAWQHLGLLLPGGMTIEPEVTAQIRRWVRPGQTVLDVGANIGFYSLLLAELVGPSGTVHSFEPDPQSGRWLLENLRLNRVGQVTPWSVALSDADGVAELHLDLKATRTTSLVAGWDPVFDRTRHRQRLRAATARLDSLGFGPVDFIKIDVEGVELRVLAGARETLARWRPVLLVEVFGPANVSSAVDLLSELDYEVSDAKTGLAPELDGDYGGNLIAAPRR